jgi:hypothetical protein
MRQLLMFLVLLLCVKSFAQKPDYPQDYFRNPLDIPILLAGNFGECRPGHFHSGLDIKTAGVENQKVHAAADGYISRIKMDKGGFGHALYITHPNGYTTLYAHLNDFAPILQMYLKKEQYAKQHWDVDVQLSPTQFPVKKGQLIAYSGNTGASTAPHLHFEIRNTKTEHPLNPQLFGLKVEDHIAPVVKEVAVYFASNEGFYESGRYFIALEKRRGLYEPTEKGGSESADVVKKRDTLFVLPGKRIGIGINVDDYMDGSTNTIAFYTGRLFFDDSIQCQITLDDIGYDETRYVNAYTDYTMRQDEQKWIQCFFRLRGNRLAHVYSSLNSTDGWLIWQDQRVHKVKVELTDDKGNIAEVVFYLQSKNPQSNQSVTGNRGSEFSITGDRVRGVYFKANKDNAYTDQSLRFSLNEWALYDDIYFYVMRLDNKKGITEKYKLCEPDIPIHTYSDLRIKLGSDIPEQIKSKVVMMYSDDKDSDGRAAVAIDSGWYKAKVRNFGTYWLDVDTTAPVIKSMQKNNSSLSKAKQITFEVKDNMTSVKTFSGYLDDKWICFEQHGDLFFYKFDEHCPQGKHKLIFKAADENGNEGSSTLTFTR